jgi:hypothetical protein
MKAVRTCVLSRAAGLEEACAGDRCLYWEAGGAALRTGCAVERLGLDVDSEPVLARHLLELRHRLEDHRTADAEEHARSRFHHLLNEAEEADGD